MPTGIIARRACCSLGTRIWNIGGADDGVERALKAMNRARETVFVGRCDLGHAIDGTMNAVITRNQLHTMMSSVGFFDNLASGRSAVHGIETPRGEIIFREIFWARAPSWYSY